MSETEAQYVEYDRVRRSSCKNCPWTAHDGHYVWCPNCGSAEVEYS